MNNELEKVLEYKANVNSDPTIKKYGLRLVGNRNYKFFKLIGITFLIICVSFIGVLFYLGTEGKLSSTYENIINPLFNASVKVDNFNTYEFNPVNNNKFSPNYTIEVNIPENLCGCLEWNFMRMGGILLKTTVFMELLLIN